MEYKEAEEMFKEEEARELLNEYRDGVRDYWIEDNKEVLRDGFIETLEDEFIDYCNSEYDMWGED